MQGKFISFEGIEGAGKSTALLSVADILRTQGVDVVCTREPGGTPLAEKLRDIIKHTPDKEISNYAELLLLFSSRADHVAQVIKPALMRGAIVLCDRYIDSTIAYQGFGRGLDLAHILTLQNMLDCMPSLTLWFDLPIQEARKRLKNRAHTTLLQNQHDKFDAKSEQFFEKLQQGFVYSQQNFARVVRIDATQCADKVAECALTAIKKHCQLTKA